MPDELRYRFYVVMPSLERLLNFEKLQTFFEVSKIEMKDSLSQGYGFLVASQIAKLIEYSIDYPFSIGMKRDILLDRARFVGLPFYRMPDGTKLGRFERNLAELCRALIGISSWDQMKEISVKIDELLLKPMRMAFDYATDIEVAGIQKQEFTEIKLKILEAASLSHFLILDHDIADIKIAFNYTYKKSSASLVQAIRLPEKLGEQEFFEGYKLGVMYLWFSFMGPRYSQYKSFKEIRRTKDWQTFGNLYHGIREEVGDTFDKVAETVKIFKLPSELESGFPEKIFATLADSRLFKQARKTTLEILDETLLYYSIRILHVNNEALAFVVLLKGYSSLTEGTVRVIKFAHPQGPGNNFSFAILMESYGVISDFSSWVLLYDFATDYSGTGGDLYNSVMESINSLGEKVLLREIQVDENELKSYAEESEMRTLETRLKQYEKLNEKSRSQLLELTTVYILSRMDYAVLWGYSKPDVLEGREIDALSVKEGTQQVHVLVVEITETLPLKADAFVREIREKIRLVRKGWRTVAADFGLANEEEKPVSIESWVITRETRGRRKLAKDIHVRDFDYLREFCESHQIPYRASLILSRKSNSQN